jgi:serine/threonine-protein kinase
MIPVVVTSIAGWRFGLPFVALSVIATGILLSRRVDGERRGLFATLRSSAGALTALMTTAVVTVLAVGASIALTAVDDNNSSSSDKTATPAKKPPSPQSSASKPVTPAPKKEKKSSKPKAEKQSPPAASTEPQPTTTEPQPTTVEPQPDPATRGLIRVPPSSAAQSAAQPTTTTPQQTP